MQFSLENTTFTLIIDRLSNGVVGYHRYNSAISYVNKAFAHMIGGSKADFIGTSLSRFLDGNINEPGALQSGSLKWTTLKNKNIHTLLLYDFPSPNIPETHFLILEDITEVKQKANKINELTEALQLRSRELDRFIYSTSHELRAPLRSILGVLNLMRKQECNMDEFLIHIEKNINRLDRLLRQNISYSKGVNHPVIIDKINFSEVLSQCLDELAVLKIPEQTKVYPQIHQPFPFFSDAFRVKVILKNIISNAVFCNSLQVQITVEVTTKAAVIKVEDDGHGMSDEILSNIFGMFYKGSGLSPGPGLGLYIVKLNLQRINGKVKIDSAVNEGTLVKVILPQLKKINRNGK